MRAQSTPALLQGHIRVGGVVQGVGFRPFVFRLATELGLGGWVRNDAEGVEIAVRGTNDAIQSLLERLQREAPPLARVERVDFHACHVDAANGFEIRASGAGRADTGISADAAVCAACLEELFDPTDRRHRYPFINCTHCGPRYSITRALPYDRPNTSMAVFPQCPVCLKEYHAPLDRRFHAQPNACPTCGPRLWLADSTGREIRGGDPLRATLARLLAGDILAVKGLGGFHLMCDARNPAAVARLRESKQREEKPLAVMFANAASVARYAEVDTDARTLLEATERPIVLLRKRAVCDAALAGVARGVAWLGALLPYTPLHYLLFHAAAQGPAGTDWLHLPQALALVCTSANPGGEPLVTDNEEAVQRLCGIADAFVLHDRDIVVRCDDSVVRCATHDARDKDARFAPTAEPAFIRRARGYTPLAIRLARPGPAVLACGAWFKNTICLTRGEQAFLSQHIGDLDNGPTCTALDEAVRHLRDVLAIEPTMVAHDLHPDFYSSRFAAAYAAEHSVPTLAVQHHHAHIGAVLAEHGHEGPVLGLALDGVGLGSDGAAWGGELLRVEGAAFERLGHLQPLALPGGDRAAREPWRVAAAALFALGRADEIARRWPGAAARAVREMLERNVHSPRTSSAGRVFDAAAGLLGVATHMSFEGRAAMLLEGLAEAHGPVAPLEEGFELSDNGGLDLLPLLASLSETRNAGLGAALFHSTLVRALSVWTQAAVARSGIMTIALGGGCFMNHILSRELAARLTGEGLRVLQARQAPPNDGGIALGQAWVAMRSMETEHG